MHLNQKNARFSLIAFTVTVICCTAGTTAAEVVAMAAKDTLSAVELDEGDTLRFLARHSCPVP